MASGSQIQTVGATEEKQEKQHAAVLVRDPVAVSKTISGDFSSWHGTYGSNVACR